MKRRKNKPADERVPQPEPSHQDSKPGLHSSYVHIAEMLLPQNPDLAAEVTRHLREPLRHRLGVYKRWPR